MKLKKLIATLSIVTLLACQVNHLAFAGSVSGIDYSEVDRNFMEVLKQDEGDKADIEIRNYLSKTEEEKAQIRNEYFDQKAEMEGLKNNATNIKDKLNNAGSSTPPSIGSNLKPNNNVYEGYDPNYNGVRQNAIQRSMVYADGIDADKIRKMASDEYSATKTKSLPTKINPQCNGYTTSSCGLACCGKTECENICKDQLMTAYGKSTCLDGVYNSSYCGISCCGKEDCERACINYRVSINGQPADHGRCFPSSVTERDTGKTVSCCGYQDCREKECSGRLTTVNQDTGETLNCCGAKECNTSRCNGYTSAQNVDTGVTYQCCGEFQCKQLECNGKVSVDSKINEGVKLSCCGTEDCESVACDGYTVANTPSGEVACCGYADCENKKCEGQTSVDVHGTLYACCGKENCNQVYEDNKFKGCGEEKVVQYNARWLENLCTVEVEICKNPTGTNNVCRFECAEYSEELYSTEVIEKCIDWTKYNCPSNATSPCPSPKCNRYDIAWTGDITIIDYPVIKTEYVCSALRQYEPVNLPPNSDLRGYDDCTCQTGGCSCKKRVEHCANINLYDETCAPRTASESQWYGRTVYTNYENCEREHGEFTADVINSVTSDVGYCKVQ